MQILPETPRTKGTSDPRAWLSTRYQSVRAHTLALSAPLSPEDQCVQSMPDASPTKWHLAHTSWFFEAVVLQNFQAGYALFDPRYLYLFNSYYEALGPRHPRPQRGLLTRPPLVDVQAYRAHVDAAMLTLLQGADCAQWPALADMVELGLQHEEQHQELLLTDILHLLSCNPLLPTYQTPVADVGMNAGCAAPSVAGSGRWSLQRGSCGCGFCV